MNAHRGHVRLPPSQTAIAHQASADYLRGAASAKAGLYADLSPAERIGYRRAIGMLLDRSRVCLGIMRRSA